MALRRGSKKLSGEERAAVLLMTLGEEHASEVLKHLGPKEVQKVGSAMTRISTVSKADIGLVLTDFVEQVGTQTGLGLGTDDFIRGMLTRALGEEKANSVLDRILLGGNKGLEALKWMDPRAIADIIRTEHPQIIAIIISYLDPDHAAEVLALFPDPVRIDVTLRVATLDGIQPSALHELNEIMERQFSGNTGVKSSNVGGVKSAANMLNFMETSMENEILDGVKEVDPELAQKIQDLMFVFENLLDVDDRSIQSLMREVQTDILVIALKGAEESLQEKFFKNMSKRAAEMLRDDLDAKGPVKLSEVETSQKEILNIARRMAEAGELVLAGAGEEYV